MGQDEKVPFAILLTPAEGDGAGLLAPGPCGAKPPTAHRSAEHDWRPGGNPGAWWQTALVLMWDEQVVDEGWDRARRVAWDCGLYTYNDHWLVTRGMRPNAGALRLFCAHMTAGVGWNPFADFRGRVASTFTVLDTPPEGHRGLSDLLGDLKVLASTFAERREPEVQQQARELHDAIRLRLSVYDTQRRRELYKLREMLS